MEGGNSVRHRMGKARGSQDQMWGTRRDRPRGEQEEKNEYKSASGGIWEDGVDLQCMPETWDGEGSQESMQITLAEMRGSGHMESEETTSYSQAAPPVEG